MAPSLRPSRTGGLNAPSAIVYVGLMTFTEEPLTTLVAALGVVGLLACLARKDYLLPLWLVVPFLVEPRNAATVAVVPVAFMAAVAAARA